MAEPAFATVADLEARMGDVDNGRALAAIEDVSSRIHLHSGRKWILDDGSLDPDVPGVCKTVCCTAARRVLENPEALTRLDQTIDNFTEGKAFSTDSNDPYLKKSEIVDIRKAAGRSGLNVLGVTRGDLETPDVREDWVADSDTDTAIRAWL